MLFAPKISWTKAQYMAGTVINPNFCLHPLISVLENAETQSCKGASVPFRQPRGLLCANGAATFLGAEGTFQKVILQSKKMLFLGIRILLGLVWS